MLMLTYPFPFDFFIERPFVHHTMNEITKWIFSSGLPLIDQTHPVAVSSFLPSYSLLSDNIYSLHRPGYR